MTLESEAYQQPEPESTHRRHEWHRAATVEHHVRSDVQTEAFQQADLVGRTDCTHLEVILQVKWRRLATMTASRMHRQHPNKGQMRQVRTVRWHDTLGHLAIEAGRAQRLRLTSVHRLLRLPLLRRPAPPSVSAYSAPQWPA